MFRHFSLVMCALSFFIGSVFGQDAAVPVARDGEPEAVIVMDTSGPGGRVRSLAAQELRDHVRAITGAALPIVRADAWDGALPAVIIGRGEASARLELPEAELPTEGFRLLSLPEQGVVFVDGSDDGNPWLTAAKQNRRQELGSLYGVYELLERWGVRWLFPGELGTVLPDTRDLSVPETDFTDGPAFSMRNWWYTPAGGSSRRTAFRTRPRDRTEADQLTVDFQLFSLRQRAGNSDDRYHTRHHGPPWSQLFEDENLELLGLYRGLRGWRRAPVHSSFPIFRRSKLNVGHPEAAQAVAQLAMDAFEASPTRMSYSICEQDGTGGFDQTDASLALDDPDARITWGGRGHRSGYVRYGRVAMTSRYVNFWNRVAAILGERFPDRYVGVYIYSKYRHLPVQEDLHPNVRAIYCNNNERHFGRYEEQLGGWAAKTPHPLGAYYPVTTDAWGVNQFGLPWVALENVRRGLLYCKELGVLGFRGDPFFRDANYSGHGLMAYAMMRWHWNPETQAEEVLDDYARHAYGAGAPAMKRFFLAIDAAQAANPLPHPAETLQGIDSPLEAHILAAFTPELMGGLAAMLDEADALAQKPAEKERIRLNRLNLLLADAQVRAVRTFREFERTGQGADEAARWGEEVERLAADQPDFVAPPIFYRRSEASVLTDLSRRMRVLDIVEYEDWSMKPDPFYEGVEERWFEPGQGGDGWRPIDFRLGYDLTGLHGSDVLVWYRKEFQAPPLPPGGKLYLGYRILGTSAELYVNGERIALQVSGDMVDDRMPFVVDVAPAGGPVVYDITEAARPGETNHIAFRYWGYTDRGVRFKPVWVLGE